MNLEIKKLKKPKTGEVPTKTKVKSSKKSTTGFTMLLIPNSSDQTKTIEITFDHLMRILASAVAIVIIMVGLLISLAVNNHTLKYGDDNTKNTILSLQEENAQLTEEVSNLSTQLASSESVLKKIEEKLNEEAQIEAQAAEEETIPTEIPVKGGTAVVLQDPTIDVANGETQDGVVFSALAGAVVVATGSGEVISVDSDPNYGNRLIIDHGNGYITTYRTNALIKAEFGDMVRKNDMIAMMTEDEGVLEYEITKDGVLVDPYTMMKE